MRYTYKRFKTEYPDNAACLKAVLEIRHGKMCPKCGYEGTKFYPIKGRKGFACQHCRRHIYPLANTIFHRSRVSVWDWFYAIYQYSESKNGIKAKELKRTLGIPYKTAWRMVKLISGL